MNTPLTYRDLYQQLFDHYGPQHWWPADSPFEVMVGAVLTQNTAWTNVERAIDNLRAAGVLEAAAIAAAPAEQLADWLRPSGYFNVKARRLQSLCHWYLEAGELEALQGLDTETLRRELLAVHGVGPETADDILLYAFERPVFVIDAYTRRLFSRLGLCAGDEPYEHLRATVEAALDADVARYNEYHALIVRHAKVVCRVRADCGACVLSAVCPGCDPGDTA